MGFFKDFKEDFQDAVDELIPGGQDEEDVMVDTLDENIDVQGELNKLDGLLEKVAEKVDTPAEPEAAAPVTEPAPVAAVPEKKKKNTEERRRMDTTMVQDTAPAMAAPTVAAASDENAVITAGMSINGDLESTGSIEVEGLIKGNVKCNGKLVVTGTIKGNSVSSEFFADAAKIEGEVSTTGTAKVGAGSVIIGNISASSAVIAGAVKGDIDVQGPVVVDTSAVVMGNIKSRSVQINNGAVIEGFCSQSYADVDVERVFNEGI
ncbi:MAG: polymer-forming cytoskeletal protein [Lachnospiraceae bacterium]|nr:polymer-forming cytoskeletal protein [Lachnospiraceae bacterium]